MYVTSRDVISSMELVIRGYTPRVITCLLFVIILIMGFRVNMITNIN